ncbi:hypothetical protein [Methylomonas sp. MgM2]
MSRNSCLERRFGIVPGYGAAVPVVIVHERRVLIGCISAVNDLVATKVSDFTAATPPVVGNFMFQVPISQVRKPALPWKLAAACQAGSKVPCTASSGRFVIAQLQQGIAKQSGAMFGK